MWTNHSAKSLRYLTHLVAILGVMLLTTYASLSQASQFVCDTSRIVYGPNHPLGYNGCYFECYGSVPANLGDCLVPGIFCQDFCAGAEQCPKGNPIDITDGTKMETAVDYQGSGNYPLEIVRRYSSNRFDRTGNFGQGWNSIETAVIENNNITSGSSSYDVYTVRRSDGREIRYSWNSNNSGATFPHKTSTKEKLTMYNYNSAQIWEFRLTDGTIEVYYMNLAQFNANHTFTSYLLWRENREGVKQTFTYDAQGRVSTVTDLSGRQLSYTYYADGTNHIHTITAPGSRVFTYEYDAENNLQYVYYPDETPLTLTDNPRLQYHYEDNHLDVNDIDGDGNTTERLYPHALTGITDERGNRYATFTYDTQGRAIASEHAGGADKLEITDFTPTTTRNALGKETIYSFTSFGSGQGTTTKISSVVGQPSPNCLGNNSSYTYDANGFQDLVTDFNGNVTDYDYNTAGFETQRIEAKSTPEERTTTTTWNTNLFLPDIITVVSHKITDYDYSNGRLSRKTETDLKSAGNPTRAWNYSYTYYDADRRQTASITTDGPRTDISDTTIQTLDVNGQLTQVSNALGQAVAFSNHNAEGLPQTVTDANGIVTELRYTTRGWLHTKTVKSAQGDALTDYEYYPNGLVQSITLPNGVTLTYTYDEAKRLTGVTNDKGERIEYTLNALGNKESETIYSATDAITKQQNRAFDELGRLLKNFGLNGQELEKFTYDGNGNVTHITNNNLVDIVQVFDGLNRLKQVTDRAGGETVYAYDDLDQLSSVTDPNSLQTTYTYNGFGFLTQQNSPDTGITNYTNYDLQGNLKSKTDARGVVTTYTYDALNRLTTVSFPANPSQNYSFSYDDTASGNKGIGRRTGASMASGNSISWVYDDRGNVIKDTRVINCKTLSTSYQYNLADNLTQITYPSGRIVNYVRDPATASVTSVTTKQNATAPTATIVSNVQYLPFGPIASLTYGNGFTQTKGYDLLYRPESILTNDNTTTLQNLSYDYDPVGTLNPITDNLNSAKSQDFTYDDLYRLTDAASGYGNYHYDYDATGNRTARSRTNSANNFSETLHYSNPLSSNKLQSVSGGTNPRSLNYTAAGNLATDGRSFSYDDNNRLITVKNGATVIGSYQHNPLGQRDSKTTSGGSTNFVYNLAGQLLHEASINPTVPSRDYIYLDGTTLAIVDNTPAAPCQATGPCPAACAAEGTSLVSQLDILRDFRDDILKPTALGRWLVSVYYDDFAPKAVAWMQQSEMNKNIVRTLMFPAIAVAWTVDFVQHAWQALALFGLAIALYWKATLSSGLIFINRKLLKIAALGVLFLSGFSWGEEIYFVHGDHLNTPQIVTDKNKAVVWKGEYTPFGEVTEVVKTIEQPLRFPGQYRDTETGLNYNMARNYDPTTGRYVQSDPIGLNGGLNTYSYVLGNPIMYIDTTGELVWTLPWFGGFEGFINLIGIIFADTIIDGIKKECDDCPPCKPHPAGEQFNKVTDTTHDHGNCLAKTGSMTHWHYDVMNQNPKTCDCFLAEHKFGGCGVAPP